MPESRGSLRAGARACYEVCTRIAAYVGGRSYSVWMDGKQRESGLSARCFGRGVGVCAAVSAAKPRGQRSSGTQRWMRTGCFERLVEDTRILLREFFRTQGPADGSGYRQSDAAIWACYDMARNGAKAPRYTAPLTPWATCLRGRLPQLTKEVAPRSRRCPKTCSKSPEARWGGLCRSGVHRAKRSGRRPEPRHVVTQNPKTKPLGS